MSAARWLGPACSLLLSGCGKTPQPSGPPLQTSGRTAPAASSAPHAGLPRIPSDAPSNLPDGCWTGMALGKPAEQLLVALAERCAPGMRSFGPGPKRVELAALQTSELAVTLDDPARCVRALAAGGTGISELELVLVDPRDRALGRDELAAPFALVGPHGPVCADEPGVHRVRVRVRGGQGSVAYGLFRAE